MKSGVYLINCIPTYKFYVGSAVDFNKRWTVHRHHLNKGNHHCIHLQRAWNKYGQAAFEFYPVEDVPTEQLLPVWSDKHQCKVIPSEQKWLDHHWDRDRLFNSSRIAGSTLGYRHSDESKAKNSAGNTGKKASDEHKANISAGKTGKKRKPFSAQHRANLSAALKGKPWSEARREAPVSEESKARMSNAQKGKPWSEARREAYRRRKGNK